MSNCLNEHLVHTLLFWLTDVYTFDITNSQTHGYFM